MFEILYTFLIIAILPVRQCDLRCDCPSLGRQHLPPFSGTKRMQPVFLKRWYTSTKLHVITSYKSVVFIASDLMLPQYLYSLPANLILRYVLKFARRFLPLLYILRATLGHFPVASHKFYMLLRRSDVTLVKL